MRLKRFLKEDLTVDLFYSYPGSDGEIANYHKQSKIFTDIVLKRGDETEIDNFKKTIFDLKKMMDTKQSMYEKDLERLV